MYFIILINRTIENTMAWKRKYLKTLDNDNQTRNIDQVTNSKKMLSQLSKLVLISISIVEGVSTATFIKHKETLDCRTTTQSADILVYIRYKQINKVLEAVLQLFSLSSVYALFRLMSRFVVMLEEHCCLQKAKPTRWIW